MDSRAELSTRPLQHLVPVSRGEHRSCFASARSSRTSSRSHCQVEQRLLDLAIGSVLLAVRAEAATCSSRRQSRAEPPPRSWARKSPEARRPPTLADGRKRSRRAGASRTRSGDRIVAIGIVRCESTPIAKALARKPLRAAGLRLLEQRNVAAQRGRFSGKAGALASAG